MFSYFCHYVVFCHTLLKPGVYSCFVFFFTFMKFLLIKDESNITFFLLFALCSMMNCWLEKWNIIFNLFVILLVTGYHKYFKILSLLRWMTLLCKDSLNIFMKHYLYIMAFKSLKHYRIFGTYSMKTVIASLLLYRLSHAPIPVRWQGRPL